MNRSGNMFFCLCAMLLLAADMGRAQTVYWSDGFETNVPSRWTATGAWHIGSPTTGPHSGANCALTQNYSYNQDGRIVCTNYLNGSNSLQLLDPALHLGGVQGARLEAFDELDFLRQHRLLALELGLLLLLVQRALLLVEFVIAGIGGERAAVDLHHLADDTVHELAVMRGHQQHAVITLEELLEPDQALEVEMVARLVQQHRVGAHQEDAGQRHAHLPAA